MQDTSSSEEEPSSYRSEVIHFIDEQRNGYPVKCRREDSGRTDKSTELFGQKWIKLITNG